MESFEVMLLLIGCVLVSSVFDQVLSRVSLPLVQIALGAVVGLFVSNNSTAVFSDPEFFLLLFIAPLLFDESRHADKTALWENRTMVASLAIGLVIVTMLIVGFVLNLIVPSVSLAAAFALGAALGPTDAAAVAAMGKDVSLSKKQESLLSGEALFNDASGVVSFEFALAAAVTGTFSLLDASVTFVVDFFGGILAGLVIAAVVMFLLNRVRSLGLETPTVFVLFEVCMPFLTFLVAESLHVSGILAVVAAGLFMRFYPNALTLESSRYAVTSKNIWDLLVFAINGVLFVLLGMKLPDVIFPTWNAAGSEGGIWLIGLVLLITALVIGIRFAWVLGMEWVGAKRQGASAGDQSGAGAADATAGGAPAVGARSVLTRKRVINALVTTLSGPKGAVTLSIVLTLPYFISSGEAFPERDLLIFLASGVILCTLLLANFVVPLLAAPDDQDVAAGSFALAKAEILQNVISELLEKSTPETELSTQVAVRAYSERLDAIRENAAADDDVRKVRIMMLADQVEFIEEQMNQGAVSRRVGERYAGSIERVIVALGGRKMAAAVDAANSAGAASAANVAGAEDGECADIAYAEGQTSVADKMKASASAMTSRVVTGASDAASQVVAGASDAMQAAGSTLGFLVRKKIPFVWTLRAVLGKIGGVHVEDSHKQEAFRLHEALDVRALKYLDTIEPHLSKDGKRAVSLLRGEVQSHRVHGGFWQKDSFSAEAPSHVSHDEKPALRAKMRALRKQTETKVRDVEAEALNVELEQIKLMREAGRLTSREARELREEVYLLQMGLEAR